MKEAVGFQYHSKKSAHISPKLQQCRYILLRHNIQLRSSKYISKSLHHFLFISSPFSWQGNHIVIASRTTLSLWVQERLTPIGRHKILSAKGLQLARRYQMFDGEEEGQVLAIRQLNTDGGVVNFVFLHKFDCAIGRHFEGSISESLMMGKSKRRSEERTCRACRADDLH